MKPIFSFVLAVFLLFWSFPVLISNANAQETQMATKDLLMNPEKKPDTIHSVRAANSIQSNYIQLMNGGGDMSLRGDPNGTGTFGSFLYNYSGSNRYMIYTHLALPDPDNPGSYLQPVMTMTNPNNNPSSTAFEISNVPGPPMMGSTQKLGTTPAYFPYPVDAITYHDNINSATGLPGADGVMDGFTGTTTGIAGFLIEHTVQIGLNAYTEHPDNVEFFFTVTNTSDVARVFGLSWNVDTQIGGNAGMGCNGDHAPFYFSGCTSEFTTQQASVGFPIPAGSMAEAKYRSLSLIPQNINPYTNSVPRYLYALHPCENQSGLIFTDLGNKNGIQWQKADYVAIAAYQNISTHYLFGVNNGNSVGTADSEHMLRWNPQVVLPGETIHLAYSYGAGNGRNWIQDAINFTDMGPHIIFTDPAKLYYINSPFTTETNIANRIPTSTVTSGTVTLKIPTAYLDVESSMTSGNKWIKDIGASNGDPNNDYYIYSFGSIAPWNILPVVPEVNLRVIPQYAADVNTTYWLTLNVVPSNLTVEPVTIANNLFIPKLNSLTITATADANGTITPEGAIPVGYGYSQNFIFTPINSNYIILDVLVDDVSNPAAVLSGSYTFTNVTENHTIHVTFKMRDATITVAANPTTGGTVTGGGIFPIDTVITVTATPINNCYTFLNWTDKGAVVAGAGATYTFTVTQSRNLVANFEQITYPVTLFKYPENGGRVYCN
ncbi:MAG: hypothetical protein FWF70_06975, partial [Bacteroidetes bacterium]|nr:hypothetical protein [Bacteroidota bacterium]